MWTLSKHFACRLIDIFWVPLIHFEYIDIDANKPYQTINFMKNRDPGEIHRPTIFQLAFVYPGRRQ